MKKERLKKVVAFLSLVSLLLTLTSCAITVTFDADGGTVVSGEIKQKLKDGIKSDPPVL